MDYKFALRKGDARALLILQQESRGGDVGRAGGQEEGRRDSAKEMGLTQSSIIESSDPSYSSFVGLNSYKKTKYKFLA